MSQIKAEFLDTGRLTPREVDVAALMAEGLSDKDISRALAISIRTVAAHTASIYGKLDLRCQSINTRCTAIITMVARGMIKLSVNSLVFALAVGAAQLDDPARRTGNGRQRTHSHVMRKDANA